MKIIIFTDVYYGGIKTYLNNLISFICNKFKKIRIEIVFYGDKNTYLKFIKDFKNYSNIKIHFISINFSNLISYIEIFLKSFFYFIIKKIINLSKKQKTIFLFNTVKSSLFLPFFHIFKNENDRFYFQFHGFYDKERLSEEIFDLNFNKSIFIVKKIRLIIISIKFFFRNYLSKFIFFFFYKIIVLSNYSKKEFLKFYKLNPNKVFLLKPGIPNLEQNKLINNTFFSDKSYLKIGIFQRLEPRKKIIEVLKVFRKVLSLNQKIILFIFTPFVNLNMNYFLKMIKEIDELNLGNNIFFINNPSNLAFFYKNIDITILSSFELETFSFSSIESLINFTPVFAYYKSGAKDYIIDKKNGFLFSNLLDLEKKLIDIVKNKKIIIEMKKYLKKNKKKLLSEYNWEKYFINLIQLK